MKALHDYIIEVKEKFNDTFKTESGVEFHLDKRFSSEKLANRIAKVVNTPALSKSIIKTGYEVLIDPTIFFTQNYEKNANNYNGYLKDAEKGWYKIMPSMIVCYRETPENEWKGFGNNLLVDFVKEPIEKITASGIIFGKEEVKTNGMAIIKYANKDLNDFGANNGDMVAIKPDTGIPFYLEKTLYWITNREVLAVVTKN